MTFRASGVAQAATALVLAGVMATAHGEASLAVAAIDTGKPPVSLVAAASAPTVGMVGNSISWQSEAAIRRHVGLSHRLVYFDAIIGATVAYQYPSVVAAARSPDGPDILLVELGANDASKVSLAQFESDVRRTLNAVTPYVDAVVWFDMKNTGSSIYPAYVQNAVRFNATLRRVVAAYPNAVVGHYSVWADAVGSSAFAADLVHLSRWGQSELGRLARQAADGFDPALRTGPFWDLTDSYWAAPAILWCASESLVSGYPDGTFRAYAGSVRFPVERGQWIAMLWRQAGAPTGQPSAPWVDTPPWLDDAARWAAASGVFRGYPDGTLRPQSLLRRAEALASLYQMAGSPPVDDLPAHGWTDVPRWVEDAARWANAAGVFNGYPDGSFRPHVILTREQAASVVHRFAHAPALPPVTVAPPSTTAPDAPPVPPVATGAPPPPTGGTTTGPEPTTTTTTITSSAPESSERSPARST